MKEKVKCLWCDAKLSNSPTVKWWIRKRLDEGICYECIVSLSRLVLRALEREVFGEK